MGITKVEWVPSAGEGLERIETALQNGVPFNLAITDMHYPLRRGEIADWEIDLRNLINKIKNHWGLLSIDINPVQEKDAQQEIVNCHN